VGVCLGVAHKYIGYDRIGLDRVAVHKLYQRLHNDTFRRKRKKKVRYLLLIRLELL
jgi:hypothetical protein